MTNEYPKCKKWDYLLQCLIADKKLLIDWDELDNEDKLLMLMVKDTDILINISDYNFNYGTAVKNSKDEPVIEYKSGIHDATKKKLQAYIRDAILDRASKAIDGLAAELGYDLKKNLPKTKKQQGE